MLGGLTSSGGNLLRIGFGVNRKDRECPGWNRRERQQHTSLVRKGEIGASVGCPPGYFQLKHFLGYNKDSHPKLSTTAFAMTSNRNSIERDVRVMQLYEELLEIEQRLIPTGLHTFGRALELREKADLLRMV